VKNSPAGEKSADQRKSRRPAKKLPTGEKAADRQKTRRPAKELLTSKKLAGRGKSCRPARKSQETSADKTSCYGTYWLWIC
jgi:hypothetical protein